MKKELTFRVIKELNKLYTDGVVKAKPYLVDHVYVKHLASYHYIHIERKEIKSINNYKALYEAELIEHYIRCRNFLEENNLLDPHWDFKEDDILTMMIVRDNKQEIIEKEFTLNNISSFYFKDEDAKYLRNSISLTKAIHRILEVVELPGGQKDQQYLICVQTKRPKLILLCENIDKLRWPDKYRAADIELWYAGGKNIAKLAHIRENENLPIHYVCDWDHDGLLIYQAIKRDYLPQIQLAIPENWKAAAKSIGKHKSLWLAVKDYDFSNLTPDEGTLMRELIKSNQWIEEESFSFKIDLINS